MAFDPDRLGALIPYRACELLSQELPRVNLDSIRLGGLLGFQFLS